MHRWHRQALRWALLIAAVAVQVACASNSDTSADAPPELTPVPSQSDSHGWGANIKGL